MKSKLNADTKIHYPEWKGLYYVNPLQNRQQLLMIEN